MGSPAGREPHRFTKAPEGVVGMNQRRRPAALERHRFTKTTEEVAAVNRWCRAAHPRGTPLHEHP